MKPKDAPKKVEVTKEEAEKLFSQIYHGHEQRSDSEKSQTLGLVASLISDYGEIIIQPMSLLWKGDGWRLPGLDLSWAEDVEEKAKLFKRYSEVLYKDSQDKELTEEEKAIKQEAIKAIDICLLSKEELLENTSHMSEKSRGELLDNYEQLQIDLKEERQGNNKSIYSQFAGFIASFLGKLSELMAVNANIFKADGTSRIVIDLDRADISEENRVRKLFEQASKVLRK
jgi:hypothetical protein